MQPTAPTRPPGPRGRSSGAAILAIAALVLLIAGGAPEPAAAGRWSLDLQSLFADVYGHDQHVLTVRRVAADGSESDRAVALETQSGNAYRFELRHQRQRWAAGLDFFWFIVTQRASLRAAGGGGERVIFEIADRSFASDGPAETLFFDRLEDTDLALWTVDLYGLRTLVEEPGHALRLQLGVRLADFDNDYRAVVGVEGAGGVRIDASSNYGMMAGPLVGIVGEVGLGKSRVTGYLGQSVVLGGPELSARWRRYAGAFSEMPEPEFFAEHSLRADRDVAIPISELRLAWSRPLGKRLRIGTGAHGSVWWDLPVPPGAVPGPGGSRRLHENTLVVYGLAVTLGLRF